MRRPELDMYERDIIEMATRYGGTNFYEYHKLFSARAAAMLEQRNIKLDWSIRDDKLFCGLFAGSKIIACEICSSVTHNTALCPQVVYPVNGNNNMRNAWYTGQNNVANQDRQGRPKIKLFGREICNNFNGQMGCFRPNCQFLHACLLCKQHNHGQFTCSMNAKSSVAPVAVGAQPQKISDQSAITRRVHSAKQAGTRPVTSQGGSNNKA